MSAVVTSRVPDLQLLLSHLHVERAGAVGHILGGWTVLAAAESDNRIASAVALAPGGSTRPRPGVLHSPLHLTRPVPTLNLTGDKDVPIPVEHVHELAAAAPDPAKLWMLRDADHHHFVDDVVGQHERLRALRLPGDAAWLTDAMLPIEKLCSADEAHQFSRGLTLAHFDATLRAHDAAAAWLTEMTEHTLAARGVHAFLIT